MPMQGGVGVGVGACRSSPKRVGILPRPHGRAQSGICGHIHAMMGEGMLRYVFMTCRVQVIEARSEGWLLHVQYYAR